MNRRQRCTKCDTEKPVNEFARRARNRSGYDAWCLQCHRDAFDRSMLPKRLKEIERLEHVLTLDRHHEDHIETEGRYGGWVARLVSNDQNFTAIEGESALQARLRWLRQRTENVA